MSTVFQLGQATIVKDLIFGWCVGHHGLDGDMYAIKDMPVDILFDLAKASYPAYLQDFKADVAAELKRRETQAEKTKQLNAGAAAVREAAAAKAKKQVDDLRPFSELPSVPRHEDRAKLMSEIISKTLPCTEHDGVTAASLGYVRVDNLGYGELPWRAVNTNGTTPWVQQFATVDEMIDRILARYW